MTSFHPTLILLMVMILFMSMLYFYAWRKKDAGMVDVGWTVGILIAALLYGFLSAGYGPRKLLVVGMAGFWSLRLAGYIFFNRVLGKEEDGRYRALRTHWGDRADRNFFFFFHAQTLLVVLFSIPLWVVMQLTSSPLGPMDLLGFAIWILAISGESLADRQLARFRRNPANRGRTCREGLWRYSRHPNYFFEWVHWLAYVAIGWSAPQGYLTLVGPVLMLIFLYKLTGIPYTEQQAIKSRGDDYRRYQQTTNKFWPWIPKTLP